MNYGFKSADDKLFPPMVVVVVCNTCNLRCIHCAHREVIKRPGYKAHYLELNLFKKAVLEISERKNSFIRISGDGEPLLHPDFPEMIRFAKQNKLYPVTVNTNGTLLNGKLAKDLLEAGIDMIEISINAFHKKTYNKIRYGADYEILISNINNFIEIRNSKNYKTKLWVSTIDFPSYPNEVAQFIEFWSKKADKVIVRPFFDHQGLVKTDHNQKINQKRFPCPKLWKRITLDSCGWLKFCENDWLNKTLLADYKNTNVTIENIWRSELYNKLRQQHLAKYSNIANAETCNVSDPKLEEYIDVCENCFDWEVMDWNYDYGLAVSKLNEE